MHIHVIIYNILRFNLIFELNFIKICNVGVYASNIYYKFHFPRIHENKNAYKISLFASFDMRFLVDDSFE